MFFFCFLAKCILLYSLKFFTFECNLLNLVISYKCLRTYCLNCFSNYYCFKF